jgi:TonB-linked SusC/RagA family outer membrane protein
MHAINTHSQEALVNITKSNLSVGELIDAVENQTNYLFLYNEKDIDLNQTVSVNKKKQPVNEMLQQAFSDTEINFSFSEDYISLRKKAFPVPTVTQQNKKQITGTVTDERGDPVIGANVIEKGTTNGVITDIDGKFTLSVSADAVLEITYIGYLAQSIPIRNQSAFPITLREDTQALEEVVVIGFGTQKRVNLTGAVATVAAKEFENRPITNAAAALQGKIANLNIYNSDGGVGKKASFNVRGYAGLGTGNDIGNGTSYSPLVIIDGVPGNFDNINPNDIENLTVLKDAAASAIYGSQAAYGVILVTTKSGMRNEKPSVNYSNNLSWASPTVLPKTAGSLEFARLFRESSINGGGSGVIDSETLERIEQYYYHPGSIPNNVPLLENPSRWADWGDGRSNANEDWGNAMFKKNQLNQIHNISVQGGSTLSAYTVSLGYVRDEGKLRYYDDNYQRYNIATKLSSDVTKWLTLTTNLRYAKERTDTPAYYMDPNGGINSLIRWIWVVWPTIPVLDPNGHFSPAGRMAFIGQANPNLTYTDAFNATTSALIKILPGWTANVDFTYEKWVQKQTYSKGLIYSWSVSNEPYLDSSSVETSQIWQNSNNDDYTSANIYTTYEKEWKGHAFKLMGGMQQEYKSNWFLSANKLSLLLPEEPSISTATGSVQADDNLDHYATRGFFGRFNYDYQSKYLFEFNLRHDGSSRYREGERWGTFPAASIGWNIAREKFWEPIEQIVSELKLRASYGELGNMRGKSYQYISTISYNPQTDYIMNGQRIGAFGTPSLIAYNTWERNRTLDFGLDLAVLNNRLNGSFDWYQRDIIGLITRGVTLPAILGANSPETNNADIRNRGFEISLNWRDQFTVANKPFNYSVFANLSDYTGVVTKYSNPSGLISDWHVGQKMGEIWGYTTDHIIIDQSEADALNQTGAQKQFGSDWSRGDMKYKDLNGDGEITYGKNTLDDPGDRSVIGNNTPRYNFGLGFNAEWNGFDLGVLLQGTGKRDLWMSGRLSWGLGGGQWESNVWENTLDCWREDGSNLDPYWPRFYLGNTSKNLQTQTKYLNNGSYCRFKNIQAGYTIPKQITQKISIDKLRIYFSGENLITFSKINENFDPEAPGDNVYPLSKSISFGISVTFK